MFTTISVEQAQERLPELIDNLRPGEEMVITRDEVPVALIVAQAAPVNRPRKPGSAKGKLTILTEDDEHLKDFSEYMLPSHSILP